MILLPILTGLAMSEALGAQVSAGSDSGAVTPSTQTEARTIGTKCASSVTLWCRYQAHDRKLEERRHYNAGWCSAYHTVAAADGAVAGFTIGGIFALVLAMDNAPALIAKGVLLGAPVFGAIKGYKAAGDERECQRDPPAGGTRPDSIRAGSFRPLSDREHG